MKSPPDHSWLPLTTVTAALMHGMNSKSLQGEEILFKSDSDSLWIVDATARPLMESELFSLSASRFRRSTKVFRTEPRLVTLSVVLLLG